MTSVYTDLTNYFTHKYGLTYQDMNKLAANDDYIRISMGAYRRPVLKWISISLVDIENNTGTANQTAILFPDGTLLSVTEDTASTTKYRRFDITATANFTSGTEDSGIRSGISEANNTWYAIYAVKSQINTANFVLAGDTTLPLQANYATLNTRYGTNSWVYLGLVRNGDNGSTAADILKFYQAGNKTLFANTATGINTSAQNGILLATTAGATTLTYTYAAGTGAAQVPANVTVGIYGGGIAAVANFGIMRDAGDVRTYSKGLATNALSIQWMAAITEGVKLSNGAASSVAQDVFLAAFFDGVLGVGSNPQL